MAIRAARIAEPCRSCSRAFRSLSPIAPASDVRPVRRANRVDATPHLLGPSGGSINRGSAPDPSTAGARQSSTPACRLRPRRALESAFPSARNGRRPPPLRSAGRYGSECKMLPCRPPVSPSRKEPFCRALLELHVRVRPPSSIARSSWRGQGRKRFPSKDRSGRHTGEIVSARPGRAARYEPMVGGTARAISLERAELDFESHHTSNSRGRNARAYTPRILSPGAYRRFAALAKEP